ncbi:MAG: tRNA threonylcarbamoyladenosine biosynthesis protein TsaE [Arenicella sp.]|jgi:tRNA threonylcarbamoyladenosine biosynthesis protein TsaE
MQLTINSIEELPQLAEKVIEFASSLKIWVFSGEMGAGKTTLIKEITKQLGVSDRVSSPTFSIVNEYETDQETSIYHFDFYRLKTPYEALDIGVEEYFDSGNLCLIEWASKIGEFLPEEYLLISINSDSKGRREVELKRVLG